MKKIITLLILLTAIDIVSLELTEFKGSIATLTSDVGEMEVSVTKNEKGYWKLKSYLDGGRIVQRKEEELFIFDNTVIKPISYSFSQRILFKKLKSTAQFDWDNKTVSYKDGKKEGKLSLKNKTLGPSTAQLQLTFDFRNLDLENLPSEIIYNVYWKGEVKERSYAILGTENVKTPMGEFLSYKVGRIFPKGSERSQTFWLAPELDFTVIRILNVDGRKTDIRLKTFKIID